LASVRTKEREGKKKKRERGNKIKRKGEERRSSTLATKSVGEPVPRTGRKGENKEEKGSRRGKKENNTHFLAAYEHLNINSRRYKEREKRKKEGGIEKGKKGEEREKKTRCFLDTHSIPCHSPKEKKKKRRKGRGGGRRKKRRESNWDERKIRNSRKPPEKERERSHSTTNTFYYNVFSYREGGEGRIGKFSSFFPVWEGEGGGKEKGKDPKKGEKG